MNEVSHPGAVLDFAASPIRHYLDHGGTPMVAIQISEAGGPEMLVPITVALPEPGPGQLRVKVAATGLNFVEVYHRKGLYGLPFPLTPGGEFAGTVDALGPGVMGFSVGDRVATVAGLAGYAEFALVASERAITLPTSLSFDQAAALLLQGMTAHYLSFSTFPLAKGHTALVHAGAGGVGLLLTQIAKRRGARVISTVSTAEKAQLARDAGADDVILYTQTDFATEVERLVGKRGVDVVYDSVGKTTFEKGLGLLRPRGMMVLFGQASGAVAPFDPQVLSQGGSLFLTRPTLGSYTQTREELLGRAGDLFGWVSDGSLHLRIDRKFPLAEAGAAQAYLESRESKGKILLIP